MSEIETETTAPASNRRILQSLRRLAVEMLVGFVGVYAAFALSAYKDKRDQIERRHQIKRALIAEIRDVSKLARMNGPEYGKVLAQFDSAVAAGTKPAPRPFFEAVDWGNHVWEATKQAGGLTILDPPTFFRLSEFYNITDDMYAQYGQMREITITQIFPGLERGPDAFYLPGTTTLRPIFGVYRTDLRRLEQMNGSIARIGDGLIATLAKDTI